MTLAVSIALAAMLLSPLQPEQPPEDYPVLAEGEVLTLGEMHGSREIPQYFLELVRREARRRHPITVGLEISPGSVQLDCRGDNARPLPPSWTRAAQDGRSSRAMRELLCALRSLQLARHIRIVYLDDEERGEDFDRRAAARFREVLTAGRGVGMILTGNYHARNEAGSLAGQLRRRGVTVRTVTVSAPVAAIWICSGERGTCGAQRAAINFCSNDPADALELRWYAISDPRFRWDYCVSFPRLTPSPPAMVTGAR